MLRFAVFFVIIIVNNLHAQSPPPPTGSPSQVENPPDNLLTRKSPDKKLIATCRVVADSDLPSNRNLDQTELVVVDGSQYHSCVIPRLINEVEWSPDSKFLVLTTSSAGGHSPWHYRSFVYCVSDNSCREIENSTFCVVSPPIHFSGPHTVDLMVAAQWHWDIEDPVSITIDLAKQSAIMKKLDTRMDSGNVPPRR